MTKAPRYDRRKYPRVRSETLVSVARIDSPDHLGWSVDVSQGGIRFQWVGLELEAGEGVRMTLDLGGRQATLVGKVVRVTALDAFAQEVALAFHEADAETVELMKDHLEDGGVAAGALGPRGQEDAMEESTAPVTALWTRAGEQAQRLGSELRRLPLVKRAEDRGRRAGRQTARRLQKPLDRLPIATRWRVATLDRRITQLTRRVGRLEKARSR